ncbi:MAG: FlgD immunoglobulin-like domain containing protein [Bacillota bacterium]
MMSVKDGNESINNKSCRFKLTILAILTVVILLAGIITATALENQVSALTVTPDPIKLGSSAYIQYTLDQNATVTINVYNESGQKVRTLLNNGSKLAGTYTQTWDGKDSSYVLVPDGYYRFTVEAKDSAGAVIGYAETTQLAARVPAVSGVSSSPEPFNPLAGQQATISYTLSNQAKVTVKILKSYTLIRTLATDELKPAGTNTIVWDGKDDYGNVAGDASYTIQIDAVSPLVATFKSTNKTGITSVEKEPPQISNYNISYNPFKLGTTTKQNISYTLSENAKVTVKILDSAGNIVKTIENAVTKNAGYNSTSWDGKDANGAPVPEGTYAAVVNAVDNFNNPSVEQRKEFVAGYQPAVSGQSVTPDPYNPKDRPATVNYTIYNDALVTVIILNGSLPVKTLVSEELQASGPKTLSWDGTDTNGNLLGDGSYYYQVTATSPTVSMFRTISKIPFSIEQGAPYFPDMTLSPNPMEIGTDNLTIRYNLSENATVYTTIYSGQTPIRKLVNGLAKQVGYNSDTWDGKDDDGNYVPEGTYTVAVSAVDPYGNAGGVSHNFTAAYRPGITISNVTPQPFNPTADTNVTVNFTLTKDAKVTAKIVKGFAVVRTLQTNVLLPAGSHTLTWDGKDENLQQAADGPYTVQIDAASPTVTSFTNTAKGDITVEAADPALTGVSVSPLIVKIGYNSTIRYTVSEPATVTVQIFDPQGQVVRQYPAEVKASGGYYSLTWDTKNDLGSLIVTGDYVLKITAVDKFNKTTVTQLAFKAGAVPVISNAAANPAAFSVTNGEQTTISFNVSERSYVTVKILDSANKLIKTVINNKETPAGPGTVTWDGTSNTGQSSPGTFTYKIDASSVVGYFRAVAATGTVQVNANAVVPQDCTGCHQNYPKVHPVANCAGCHGNDEPIQDCAFCHTTWPAHTGGSFLTTYQCEYCHNSTYSYKVPQHGDIAVIHTSPAITADCQKCHDPNLTIEHPKYQDPVTLLSYDCNTCHQSTKTTVQQAIYNRNTNCAGCHTGSGHEAQHTPTGIQNDCAKCHIDSLTTEHLNNPKTQTGNAWTCNTCHASTVSTVVYAVYNNLKNCDACHTQAAHEQLHATTSLDRYCTTCHVNSLTQEHLNNPKTQTDPVTGQVNPYTCDTCHASNDPLVIGAIVTDNKQCAACHRLAHSISLAENVPADIPLYPGYIWTQPQDASLWAGESWMPDVFLVGGKVLISNRRTDVVGDAVYGFYTTEMAVNQWTPASPGPAPGSNYFKMTYTKGIHKAIVWFYGGADHNAEPVLSAGYRLDIIYK